MTKADARLPASRATWPPARRWSRKSSCRGKWPRAICSCASPMQRAARSLCIAPRSLAERARRSPAAGHRTACRRRQSPAPTNCSSPACIWSSIATPRDARRCTGARRCGAIRSIAAATMPWDAGISAVENSALAETHFRQAIERLTLRNPNPYDGEPFYNLGLCLRHQIDAAADAKTKLFPGSLLGLLQGHVEPSLGRRRLSRAGRNGLPPGRLVRGSGTSRPLAPIRRRQPARHAI